MHPSCCIFTSFYMFKGYFIWTKVPNLLLLSYNTNPFYSYLICECVRETDISVMLSSQTFPLPILTGCYLVGITK